MRVTLLTVLVVSLVLAGCNKDELLGDRAGKAPQGLNSQVSEVASENVVSGFSIGHRRKEYEIAAFTISSRPITVGQLKACIAAGACTEPVLDCADLEGDDEDAVLCAGFDNARSYCSWSGGRLPHLNEWFLAARGRSPRRFAWGDETPSCERHPRATPRAVEPNIEAEAEAEDGMSARTGAAPEQRPGGDVVDLGMKSKEEPSRPLARDLASSPAERARAEQAEGARAKAEAETTACGEPVALSLRVGQHESGKSPRGIEDVLLGPAELLVGHRDTQFSACMDPDHGCVVYGLHPGAIDGVKRLVENRPAVARTQEARMARDPNRPIRNQLEHAYTFRCVWLEEDQ